MDLCIMRLIVVLWRVCLSGRGAFIALLLTLALHEIFGDFLLLHISAEANLALILLPVSRSVYRDVSQLQPENFYGLHISLWCNWSGFEATRGFFYCSHISGRILDNSRFRPLVRSVMLFS